MSTRNAHDLATVVAAINPQSIAATTTSSSGWVDMSKFSHALFILSSGVIDTLVDFKLVEAKDSIGTGSQDLASKAIVQAPITDDNYQYGISVSDENLSRNSGYRYVRAVVTTGAGTTSLLSLVAIGLSPKQLPASDWKSANMVQTIG